MRTSDIRFLVEAYVFYEAILSRRYFEGSEGSPRDLGVRSKELRFYARFLLVSIILNRSEMVNHLMDCFMALVDDCRSNFRVNTLLLFSKFRLKKCFALWIVVFSSLILEVEWLIVEGK
ncbi:hypothetical protein S83_045757 [Arachis hypogaea]